MKVVMVVGLHRDISSLISFEWKLFKKYVAAA